MGTEPTKNRFLKREGSSSSQQSLKPALVEIARLLARQAAHEWAEGPQGANLSQNGPICAEPRK